mmetsp:Transcript_25808/g.63211  ORF Transcript_25808/g.63211 Transcript_25808/m.63211 type:complete len:114 (+) Transcript_25808:49-390(+)
MEPVPSCQCTNNDDSIEEEFRFSELRLGILAKMTACQLSRSTHGRRRRITEFRIFKKFHTGFYAQGKTHKTPKSKTSKGGRKRCLTPTQTSTQTSAPQLLIQCQFMMLSMKET